MNNVYVRIVFYALSFLIGMIPASMAGLVSYDAASQMLHVSVGGLATAIAGGLASSGAVFSRWGIK